MKNDYNMIVIGAGIAGLSTALAWSKVRNSREQKILVLERNPVVGGCVATFSRGGFQFDTVQIIPDIADLLGFFGIDLPMKLFDKYYTRIFIADPGTRSAKIFPVYPTRDKFKSYLSTEFPDEASRINAFFDYCGKIYDELHFLKTEPGFKDIISILLHCPKILSNSSRTYRNFLDGFHFKDRNLLDLLDVFSSFSGFSGERCAALLTVSAMMTTLDGAWRPQKGFIQLPLAMKDKLIEAGVEIRTRSEVRKILIKNGCAYGVELENREQIRAEHIVTTADSKISMEKMVGYDILASLDRSFEKKIRTAAMSPSSFNIHLGLDDRIDFKALGFDCGYNVLTTGGDSFDKMFQAWDKDEMLMDENCFHIATISSSVMVGGKNNLVIHIVPAAMADWSTLRVSDPEKYRKKKEATADFYIKKVEEYMIPGLSSHIVMKDISTPATFERWIGSPTGSNFDMLPVPGNFGKNRLRTRTPVKNLFMPKFSHGIWPAMQAGLQVADMISGGKIMDGNSRYKKDVS